MKNTVKKILFGMGLEINRRPKVKRTIESLSNFSHHCNGKVIEFMGPSGVGKSYLREGVAELLEPNWVDGRFLDWESFESSYLDQVPAGTDEFYGRLCCHYAQDAFSNDLWHQTSDGVMRHLSFQLANIRKHLILEAGLPFGTIMDEGLVFILRNTLSAAMLEEVQALEELLRRRYVIILNAPPSLVLERIERRFKEKPARPEYRGFSREKILDSVKKQSDEIHSFIEQAEPKLGGVLRLEGDAPKSQNVGAIKKFINAHEVLAGDLSKSKT